LCGDRLAFTVHPATGVRTLIAVLFAAAVALPSAAWADASIAAGPVTLAFATATPSEPAQYRRQIFLTDRVKTGDRTFARLLLGGRVLVLAREASSLSITEVPGATTIDVESGRIVVTVDRENLHPEDLIEVRTPHAVVSVPSDTLVVEVAAAVSTFSVFAPRVEVFRLDPVTGAAVEPPTWAASDDVVMVDASPPAAEVVAARR
jgi:hypothetical protein